MENRPTTWNGVDIPFNASVAQLASLVHGPVPQRWAAFVALAHTPGQPALTILADSARSTDPHVRRAAVEAIGIHADGHRLGALICSLVSDTYDFVARSACEAAARHRVTAAHDAIVQLLDATPEASRVAALQSLPALWQDADVERVLHAYSTARSATVRREAAWTLRSTESRATWPRLFALWCDDTLPRHRQWACELAAKYGRHDVRKILERLTHDVDGHVRAAAARAIVAIEARENP